jgi:D-serine deaminase-like pyridoxal phosphate-dependent protein
VSAGGSLYFDRVVEGLAPAWDLPVLVDVILRSGSYITHDDDVYDRLSPFGDRGGGPDRFRPALEVWAMVLSRPEPDLAIVGMGKRDVPYDTRLPIPHAIHSGSVARAVRGEMVVTKLNDQHAFLHLDGEEVAVGDLVGFGISHPCTTFDKWRLLPLVDDSYRVTGAIRTYF